MACRAVHFAITDDDLTSLRESRSDNELVDFIQEVIEERWEVDEGFVCQTDKAWGAIHRCLTDGKLEFENGTGPLRLVILGGEQLHFGDDYIVALVPHDQLRAVANELAKVTPEFFQDRYLSLPADYGSEKSSEDCQYCWDWFSDLPVFFDRAEKAGRHVIFTVDQ